MVGRTNATQPIAGRRRVHDVQAAQDVQFEATQVNRTRPTLLNGKLQSAAFRCGAAFPTRSYA